MAYEATIRTRAFSGTLEMVSTRVDEDGTVRAYDSVAGHYTVCHSIPASTVAKLRRAAKKAA